MLMNKYTHINHKKRYFYLCSTILVLFAAIFLRLGWLQIVRGDELQEKAANKLTANLTQKNPRGKIVDRDGEELAVSIMTGSLYVDPLKMEDEGSEKGKRDARRLSADLLAPILKMNADELYQQFNEPLHFMYLKRTMEPKDVEAVKKLVKEHKLPGIHFLEESKRYYTKKGAAAQVIGFVGTDDKGLSGIELQLDDVLRGKDSKYKAFFDTAGNQILGKEYQKGERKSRLSTVYLTLDSKMQYVLEDAMDNAIARTKSKGAAAIIMDPYTGEILGMASRPTFDPNEFWKAPSANWNNKGISMIYEPGSVFKPIVGCMGLTEGLITPDTLIQDNGSIKIADRIIHNWDGEGMGLVPFSEVIKFSINTGMVQLGMELGAYKLISYSEKFGLGSPTNIDLPGEEAGILYDPRNMYEPDVATMAIGQGIAVTPLQILRAICSIANGGDLMQPYIVKKIVDADGNIVQENKPKIIRRVITEQVASQMRYMMEKVVSEGGGKPARIQGYRIAGKTGTAEKLAAGGGYAAGEYIASFVGFVPADKPKYAMLVMLDTPQGAFYGSQVSAPIFRDTLQQILVAKGIQPSNNEGLPSFDEAADKKAAQKKTPQVFSLQVLPNGKIKLPDFTGINMRQAAEVLSEKNLKLHPYGSGKAYQQKPTAGTEVDAGTAVEIWFK